MTARNYLGTLNNPKVETRDYLEKWSTVKDVTYVCGQLEKGENGTVHIQYFLNFKNSVRVTALKKHCGQSHFEVVKINNGAHDYCMKEDTRVEGPYEFGIKPVQRNNKHDWEEVKLNAIKGELDKIPAEIYIKHYRTLKLIEKDHIVYKRANEERQCFWYYGHSGSGKSRKAYELYPEAYRKMANKWWDGYAGQKAIILDDLDPTHACLGHHLKIWGDRYPFTAEAKGGAVAPVHDIFIVTSQYHPQQIWNDNETVDAILRRFELVKFPND